MPSCRMVIDDESYIGYVDVLIEYEVCELITDRHHTGRFAPEVLEAYEVSKGGEISQKCLNEDFIISHIEELEKACYKDMGEEKWSD